MKRFLLFSLLAVVLVSTLFVTSCRKKYNDVSIEVTVSYPIMTLLNGKYFSINIGGALPATSVIASAYDTFYKQNCPVVVDFTQVSNLSAGLYPAYVSAKNLYGFTSYDTVWIGVTNVSDTLNLSGTWINNFLGNQYTYVNKVANGFFTTTNLLGVDVIASPAFVTPSFFLVTSVTGSSANVVFPSTAPDLVTYTAALNLVTGDTTMVYYVNYSGVQDTVNYFK